MDLREYEVLHKTEKYYWWFLGQRFLLFRLLRERFGGRRDLKLLDVGCGTGVTVKALERLGDAMGVDVSDKALAFCKLNGVESVKGNVMDLPFDENSFDVVTSLGLFYHEDVTDDVRGFREINKVLKPGGKLFIMDCASKRLFGKHDVAFHGGRRYSKRELVSKLQKVGFVVERASYFTMLFYPLVYIRRKMSLLFHMAVRSDVQDDMPAWLNRMLLTFYKMELRMLTYVNFPFGVNVFAVARKK
jgi:SAM-dependent methyltransferase